MELFEEIPPRWEDRTEDDWLAYANAVKRKVYDGRFEFPREWPFYLGWNAQHSNAPGTTCFLPIVDNTRQYINVLLILLSESTGKAPLFIDDWRPFRPRGAMEWAAWAASKLGLVEPIPYQPIGGLARVRDGFTSKDVPAPLGSIGEVRTEHEAYFLMQNLMLTGEALRLGGWVHGAPMIPHVMRRDPVNGLPRPRLPRAPGQARALALAALAAGARLAAELRRHRRRARGPVPAVRDATWTRRSTRCSRRSSAAAARTPTPTSSGRPTATARAPSGTCNQAPHHPPEAVEYTKEICRYLVETYGRFPAHTDAFYLPGTWVQFSHLEIEYYERFGHPGHARRQAEGREIWGRS